MHGRRHERFFLISVIALCGAIAWLVGACGSNSAAHPSEMDRLVVSDWAAAFEQHDGEGTIVVHQLGTGVVLTHNSDRAEQPYLPASTFKILNSLIALNTGAVSSVDEQIPWDGVARSDGWDRDHSLRSGIQVSAVWMYQEVARRVGEEDMASLVAATEYGNADIGGDLDRFWLDGELRISAVEQLDLMTKLMEDDLPFEVEHQAAVRDILVRASGEGWSWGHKTGLAAANELLLGWLVGYTEYDGSTWVFAMNVDLGETDAPSIRTTISCAVLASTGALPTEACFTSS